MTHEVISQNATSKQSALPKSSSTRRYFKVESISRLLHKQCGGASFRRFKKSLHFSQTATNFWDQLFIQGETFRAKFVDLRIEFGFMNSNGGYAEVTADDGWRMGGFIESRASQQLHIIIMKNISLLNKFNMDTNFDRWILWVLLCVFLNNFSQVK